MDGIRRYFLFLDLKLAKHEQTECWICCRHNQYDQRATFVLLNCDSKTQNTRNKLTSSLSGQKLLVYSKNGRSKHML